MIREIIVLLLCSVLLGCSSNPEVTNKEEKLVPYTGYVTTVKEYVDSVEKFVFYANMEANVGVCGYQFTYHSDSVFDPRVNRVISRFNHANRFTYKTTSSNDTVYSFSTISHLDDTLVSSESATFIAGNKKIKIREFKTISTAFWSRHGGTHYFSDKYGIIETVFKNGKWSDLRISIKSASFLDKHELKELQIGLRKHPMYMN